MCSYFFDFGGIQWAPTFVGVTMFLCFFLYLSRTCIRTFPVIPAQAGIQCVRISLALVERSGPRPASG